MTAVVTPTALTAARTIGHPLITTQTEALALRRSGIAAAPLLPRQPLHPNAPVRNGLTWRSSPTVVAGPWPE